MKLSFDWLGDYVDLRGLTAQEVADKLTMGAFEVEEIREFGPDIQGDVVVGEILEINKHPDADKVRVTKTRVKDGEEPLQICCGAWNIEVGQRVPVALPGSKVINRKDGTPLPIGIGKIRGVESAGMLCSPPELGIAGGEDGILILPDQPQLGSDVRQLLGIKRDSILIVGSRSNRGDALSVIGLAREVAALFGRPLLSPQWQLPAESDSGELIETHIESTDDCPYFTIRRISDVKNGPSPEWMSRRLEAIGVRSVSALVDITNYVMHEYGQPLHAYDVREVQGDRVEVRRARKGETLVTLDERKRELTDEVLVIADKNRVIGVAGVMGGKGSEIADDTTSVALEAASFHFARVRRSSRLLGLSSDSSLRFERGVDVGSVRKAADRAAYLMTTICGGKLGRFSSAGSDEVKPLQVTMRMSELARLTEIAISTDEVATLLTPLGFEVTKQGDAAISAKVPSFRNNDVTREVDLVEEVTRLYGYDKVPVSMPNRTIAPPLPDTTVPRIKDALSACGLSEAWTSSLVALTDITGRGTVLTDDAQLVRVLNPLSEDHQVLRTTLLPGLLKAAAYNQDRGREDVWLFEIGLTYKRDPETPIDRSNTGTAENTHVAAFICGENKLSQWEPQEKSPRKVDTRYFELKGILENMLDRLAVPVQQLQFVVNPEAAGWFHPSRSAQVLLKPAAREKGEPIPVGWIGEVHPAVGDAYGLKSPAAVFELSVDKIRAAQRPRAFWEIPNTPSVVRDITADLGRAVEAGSVQQVITQVGGKLLQQVDLVSVFDLSDDQKSLSYRLVFQDAEKTLTADEVEKVMGKVRQQLTRQLSASFRS